MPRRPFGSRIDRTVRLSPSTESGPGPTHHPKHGPHGGGPAATPALTRGGCSRDDLGRRPRGGCRGGRSARESTATLPRRRAPSGGRESVVYGKRVDLGGGRILTKKPSTRGA